MPPGHSEILCYINLCGIIERSQMIATFVGVVCHNLGKEEETCQRIRCHCPHRSRKLERHQTYQ